MAKTKKWCENRRKKENGIEFMCMEMVCHCAVWFGFGFIFSVSLSLSLPAPFPLHFQSGNWTCARPHWINAIFRQKHNSHNRITIPWISTCSGHFDDIFSLEKQYSIPFERNIIARPLMDIELRIWMGRIGVILCRVCWNAFRTFTTQISIARRFRIDYVMFY